jgi:hypothetical protein
MTEEQERMLRLTKRECEDMIANDYWPFSLRWDDLELAPPKLETETAILEEITRLFGLLYEMNPDLLELGKWFLGAELDGEDDAGSGSSPEFDALVKKYYGDEEK